MSGMGGVPEKPSWGKTIGVFFLCWAIAVACCAFASLFIAQGMGFSGFSTGGLLAVVAGAISGAIYRSTGKMASPIIVAVLVGAVMGLVPVYMGTQM